MGIANDIRRLPPEFTRAERQDGVFFVDLPPAEQRRAIWKLFRGHYDIGAEDHSLGELIEDHWITVDFGRPACGGLSVVPPS